MTSERELEALADRVEALATDFTSVDEPDKRDAIVRDLRELARRLRPQVDASDADIEAWAERHDIAHAIRGTDARAAFEDAQTWHLTAALTEADSHG